MTTAGFTTRSDIGLTARSATSTISSIRSESRTCEQASLTCYYSSEATTSTVIRINPPITTNAESHTFTSTAACGPSSACGTTASTTVAETSTSTNAFYELRTSATTSLATCTRVAPPPRRHRRGLEPGRRSSWSVSCD